MKAKTDKPTKPRKSARPRKREQKLFTDWDWTTLVAAWRYYEYGSTISSATFPAMIVERFFRGDYGMEVQRRIAHQFANVDHEHGWGNEPRSGEKEWERKDDCDRRPWTKFYAFCWHFTRNWKVKRGVRCFHCDTTGRDYPVDEYIKNPHVECWMPDENDKKEGMTK